MSSGLADVKLDISKTRDAMREADRDLAEAKASNNAAAIASIEARRNNLVALLVEQQRKENYLLQQFYASRSDRPSGLKDIENKGLGTNEVALVLPRGDEEAVLSNTITTTSTTTTSRAAFDGITTLSGSDSMMSATAAAETATPPSASKVKTMIWLAIAVGIYLVFVILDFYFGATDESCARETPMCLQEISLRTFFLARGSALLLALVLSIICNRLTQSEVSSRVDAVLVVIFLTLIATFQFLLTWVGLGAWLLGLCLNISHCDGPIRDYAIASVAIQLTILTCVFFVVVFNAK